VSLGTAVSPPSHTAVSHRRLSPRRLTPVLRRVMRDTRPPTDLRQSKARIEAQCSWSWLLTTTSHIKQISAPCACEIDVDA